MSRPSRIEYPGAVYHVMSRGVNRQRIFADDDDHGLFIGILAHTLLPSAAPEEGRQALGSWGRIKGLYR